MSNKKNVLFIGSFKSKSNTGHVGGQMFACNSLLESELKNIVNWITLDTTASTNRERSFYVRALGAAKRMIIFIFHLLFSKVDTVLIFTSHGWGFREKGLMIILASFLKKKTIIAPRSGHLIQDISTSSRFKSFAEKVFARADYILCQGTFWKIFFSNQFGLDKKKLIILHNWINLADAKDIATISYEPKKELTILYLGWLDKKKGIFDLVAAAKKITNPTIRFVIGGKGNDEEALVEFIQQEELRAKIHLAGWVLGEQKNKLLEAADVLVLPSYTEGSPNVILEAMKFGIPVVASNVGAIPDLIEHKKNGLLIEPGNIDAIKESIIMLCESSAIRKKYAQESFQKLKEQHSIERAVHLLSDILK